MKRLILLSLLFFSSVLAAPAMAQTLVASDGDSGDHFGRSVAGNGDVLVVGAPYAEVNGHPWQGAVYVFVRRRGEWVELTKLTASDGGTADGFGSSIAVSGNHIVVGAPYATANSEPDAGAVYVFRKRSGQWQQTMKIVASDARAGAEFGFSVAIDGKRIVVGSPSAHVNFGPPGNFLQGAAYVYSLQQSRWNEDAKLAASDANRWALFGLTVAISNQGIIIGSPGRRNFAGAAYVFKQKGKSWHETLILTPGPASRGQHIGYAVAADGNQLAVGVPYESLIPDTLVSGVVHVYRRFQSQPYDNLVASDWTGGAFFGGELAMSGSQLAIGAPDAGEAYLFIRDEMGAWQEAGIFLPVHDGSGFGESVALAGKQVVIGHGNARVDGQDARGAVSVHAIY